MKKPSDPVVSEADEIVDNAEKYAEAQLLIVRVLKQMGSQADRRRVICAVSHILAAEELIPGVMKALAK